MEICYDMKQISSIPKEFYNYGRKCFYKECKVTKINSNSSIDNIGFGTSSQSSVSTGKEQEVSIFLQQKKVVPKAKPQVEQEFKVPVWGDDINEPEKESKRFAGWLSNIPQRGKNQLGKDGVKTLTDAAHGSRFDKEIISGIVYIKGRKEKEQFSADDIKNLIVPLHVEPLLVRKFLYIPGRKEQFTSKDIATISREIKNVGVDRENYEKTAQQLSFVKERGDKQFDGADIAKISCYSRSKESTKAINSLVFIKSRGDKQLSADCISKLMDIATSKYKYSEAVAIAQNPNLSEEEIISQLQKKVKTEK